MSTCLSVKGNGGSLLMFKTLKEDIQNIFAKDPAAKNTLEVILCYPGLHAIWIHRKEGITRHINNIPSCHLSI